MNNVAVHRAASTNVRATVGSGLTIQGNSQIKGIALSTSIIDQRSRCWFPKIHYVSRCAGCWWKRDHSGASGCGITAGLSTAQAASWRQRGKGRDRQKTGGENVLDATPRNELQAAGSHARQLEGHRGM